MIYANFQPANMTATTTMSVTTANTQSTIAHPNSEDILVYNAGPNLAFLVWDTTEGGTVSSATATTSGVPLPVGSVQLFHKGAATLFAAICGTGSATVYITPGRGL